MMARRGSSKRRRAPRKKKTALRTTKARGTAIARSFGLSIEDDRLVGAGLSFVETRNKGGDLAPRYLVFHYTVGKSATSSINWLTNPESKASAHLVLARDGTITQLAPFNVKTWHAGVSHWDGLSGLDSSSIGIEMDNAGPLKENQRRIKGVWRIKGVGSLCLIVKKKTKRSMGTQGEAVLWGTHQRYESLSMSKK